MRELAHGMGARTEDEIRAALELVVLACQLELTAETKTPRSAPRKASRLKRKRRR